MTLLSHCDSMCSMTHGTAEYGEAPMAEQPARTVASRARTTRADETRAALLVAAHDLLATEGPSALTVRRIATAAGMSTMNVYSRFGGKDGVLEELFTDGFTRLGHHMVESPTTADPLADLRRCGDCYLRFARENSTYYSLMFDRAVPDFEPSPEAVAHAIDTLDRVAERVQRAMDAGVIRRGSALDTAAALWACEHGLASLEARTPAHNRGLFDWDVIAEVAIGSLLRGLAPDP